jgi:hypothetical protein
LFEADLQTCEIPLSIADCQLPISNLGLPTDSIGNRKLAIGNVWRRQSAVRAHNALTACYAKAADLSVKFFGSNASASILP